MRGLSGWFQFLSVCRHTHLLYFLVSSLSYGSLYGFNDHVLLFSSSNQLFHRLCSAATICPASFQQQRSRSATQDRTNTFQPRSEERRWRFPIKFCFEKSCKDQSIICTQCPGVDLLLCAPASNVNRELTISFQMFSSKIISERPKILIPNMETVGTFVICGIIQLISLVEVYYLSQVIPLHIH